MRGQKDAFLWFVAKLQRYLIIPPGTVLLGNAVYGDAIDGLMLDANHDKLGHIFWSHPYLFAATVALRSRWIHGRIADADDEALDAEFFIVKASFKLIPAFAETIKTIGAHSVLWTDALSSLVKTCNMVAGAQNNSAYAADAGCLVDVMGTENVDPDNILNGPLIGKPGEMNNGVHALQGLFDCIEIANIRLVPGFAVQKVAGICEVQNAHGLKAALQLLS